MKVITSSCAAERLIHDDRPYFSWELPYLVFARECEHVDGESLNHEQVTEKADFQKDLCLDSLDRVELVMAFEQEFSIEIPEEKADELKCCADVAKYIISGDEQKITGNSWLVSGTFSDSVVWSFGLKHNQGSFLLLSPLGYLHYMLFSSTLNFLWNNIHIESFLLLHWHELNCMLEA